MSEKFTPCRKIGFQNTLNTKGVNVIIDSNGPSIILRSIYVVGIQKKCLNKTVLLNKCLNCIRKYS